MDVRRAGLDLAEEHGMHAVVVLVEGGLETEHLQRLLAEATQEVQAMAESEGWPVWWLEQDEHGSVVVLDGLAMEVKQALVDLEESHPLGQWWNLDLVTVLPDGEVGEWHRSPMRPEPRRAPSPEALQEALAALETDS
ncbi:citrate lyase holo-[acyl-carrier protein] synthase [Luteococcus sp. Sow4_B9]|uniref:citrate lyase holo-[acyl-carrier protein] synthase n=1 Tax=Luteococcus sp. Sow4_B9 TaxID=3438792 RepID=UPI003F9BFF8C